MGARGGGGGREGLLESPLPADVSDPRGVPWAKLQMTRPFCTTATCAPTSRRRLLGAKQHSEGPASPSVSDCCWRRGESVVKLQVWGKLGDQIRSMAGSKCKGNSQLIRGRP